MTGCVVGYDAIASNVPALPKGARVYAGYATGSGDVPWSEAQFAAHATMLGPCLRIDQDPAASDGTADILDVEGGAGTVADCPGWARRAQESFDAGTRPGQRRPAIYCSADTVESVVAELTHAGAASGVSLIIADWDLTQGQAVWTVMDGSGPCQVAGVQFADDGPYDVDVFSAAWLAGMSGDWKPPAPVPAPPARPPTVPSWGPWTTAGDDSLGTLASAHGTAASTVLRVTAEQSPQGEYEPEVAGWLEAVFAGTADPTAPMPAGLRLWLPGLAVTRPRPRLSRKEPMTEPAPPPDGHEGLLDRLAAHLPDRAVVSIPAALKHDLKLHAADVFDVADLALQVTETLDPSLAGVAELVTKVLALAQNAARIAGQVHATS